MLRKSIARSLLAGVLLALASGAQAQYRDEDRPDGITAQSRKFLLGQPYTGKAEPAPRLADGHVSLNGVWKLLHEEGRPDGNLAKDLPGYRLPYTAKGRAQLAANYKEIDPEARCILTGFPRALTQVFPFEIVQTPRRTATLGLFGGHRWIWSDGRKPPVDPDPRYSGNAIGHWEGDTFVVRSSVFHDSREGKAWLDDNANPISAGAILVERYTRPDKHHLDLELTYTDTEYYTAPIRYSRHYVLAPEGQPLPQVSCEWNTEWVLTTLAPGPGEIGADGNRYFGPDRQDVPDWPIGSVGDPARATGYWLYRKNKPKPSDLPADAQTAQAKP